MSGSRLRIAVTGLAASYPLGGVFWDYMQYALGLHGLGHDVLYIEDTGQWCYEPQHGTFVEDGAANAAYLARNLSLLEPALSDRWFFRDARGATFGRPWSEVVRFCRDADLFIHVSASCLMREEYFAASTVAFIDSDPMHTQASIPDYVRGTIEADARARVEAMLRHDVFFTFGENIGAADCTVPADLIEWIPTRQPITLDRFAPSSVPTRERRRLLTTVLSWAPYEHDLVVDGVPYFGKAHEFARFTDLPDRASLPIELAISGAAPVSQLIGQGWRIVDGSAASRDPWAYRDYLAHSWGEWSVAKHAYVASRSGWFSCRTACYLALGVPAVVQGTGFDVALPGGDGLFAFDDTEGALGAIEAIRWQPERHAKAAREIAQEYFDARRVLERLIHRALAQRTASAAARGA